MAHLQQCTDFVIVGVKVCFRLSAYLSVICVFIFFLGEKLVVLKSRLQQAMAIRRKEERERRAALHRLDNEDCEEEEAEMTESEDEEVPEISITLHSRSLFLNPFCINSS